MSLNPEFIAASKKCLPEIFRVWLAVEPVDLRRVMRPAGPNTHSISIEPYRGSRTWIEFDRAIRSSDALRELSQAIDDFQPELRYQLVLPDRALSLADSGALISTWCRFLEDRSRDGSSTEDGIESLIGTLDEVLETKTLTESVVTVLAGIQLPAPHPTIELAGGAFLRSLTEEELIELGAHDVTFGHRHDLLSHSVSSCFEVRRTCTFSLEPTHPETLLGPVAADPKAVTVESVLRALHALKSGRAGVFLIKTDRYPRVLPNLGGGSSWPLQRPSFSGLVIEDNDVAAFLTIEEELRKSGRDELRIAADRLADAENRLSKVDALLDAVIGLEVLLNPMDSSELAFRVALNYAFLSPAEHRRDRYDRVRQIQKIRNRVVHGGLSPQSPDASTLDESAALAIACLRDALKCFLLDDSLRGNRKLDASFWLDRLFPPTILGDVPKLNVDNPRDAG